VSGVPTGAAGPRRISPAPASEPTIRGTDAVPGNPTCGVALSTAPILPLRSHRDLLPSRTVPERDRHHSEPTEAPVSLLVSPDPPSRRQ
jgi:hypothetical protein